MAVGAKNPVDSPAAIASAIGVAAAAALYYNILPLVIGAAQESGALPARQVGLLSTAFFSGFTLVSASAYLWLGRVSWRLAAGLALPLAALFLAAGAMAPATLPLLASIALAGAGFGVLYGIAALVIAGTGNPVRWYAVKISSEVVLGVLAFLALPPLVVRFWGFPGLMLALALVACLFIPALRALPLGSGAAHAGQEAGESPAPAGQGSYAKAWVALFGCLMFMGGQTIVWAFAERIGDFAGHDPVAVGRLLALTLVFALAGSLAAAWVGERRAKALWLTLACLCFFVALGFLHQAHSFMAYAVGACLLLLSAGFGVVFAVALVAQLDPNGRFVVLTVPAFGFGILAGPGIAGHLTGGGFSAVLMFGALTVAAALAAFLFGGRSERTGGNPADG